MKVSFSQLEKDAIILAAKIPKDKYKFVFGIPSGGLIPGYIVAKEINAILIQESELESFAKIYPTEVILVVDDLIDSGKTLSKYSQFDSAVIYVKKHSPLKSITYSAKTLPNEWVDFPHEKGETGIEEHIIRIIEYIGEDANREGLIDTPKRVVRMYGEIFAGYDKKNKPKITTFENGKDNIFYDQMIMDEGMFYSHCEHHIVPFSGKYYFAYIPDKTLLGLSKVARIVDYYSAKLQIQERLVKEIVDELYNACQPKGMGLIMKGHHLCKEMRGAKKVGVMTTTELRGSMKEDKVRAEFLKSISIKL